MARSADQHTSSIHDLDWLRDTAKTKIGDAQVAHSRSSAHILDFAPTPTSDGKRSLATSPNESAQQSSMPGPHAGLKPWPTVHNPNRNTLPATSSVPHFSRPSPVNQISSASSTSQAYYEPEQQPLSVSQQTSASAVRDMALRKGSPAVLKKERANDQRPLKSALKPFSPSMDPEPVPLDYSQFASPVVQSKDRLRFARLSNLLSGRSSQNTTRSAGFSPLSRTASGASHRQTTTNVLKPKRSIGWEQPLAHQYDESGAGSVRSDVSDQVRRAKLAGGDVYEQAKTNIRRPPKGIKNWFDGFDVSSDEDDTTPLAEPGQVTPQQHARDHHERRQESFEQSMRSPQQRAHDQSGHVPSKIERMLGHSVPVARADHDSLHDRLVPADTDRHQTTTHDDYFGRINTPKPHRDNGYSSSQHTSTNSRGSSYTGNSTDRSEQYHRGSDHYSTSTSEAAYNHATSVNIHRPVIPPRRMHNVQNASYEDWAHRAQPQLSSYQPSSTRPPIPSYNSSSKLSSQSRGFDDEHDEQMYRHYASASSSTARNRGRSGTRTMSSRGQSDSTGGVPLTELPSDLQHMMAVTDEEMALLEMMRNKRATMSKPTYTKRHRKALEREHEQLMQRRLLAQQTALKILRDQQQMYMRGVETEETNDTTDGEADEHEIMRLGKLRQEELNRTLRLEKFLATNASLAAALQETGFHSLDARERNRQSLTGDSRRPRTPHTQRSQQESERTLSRNDRYNEDAISPLDLPSPPAYEEDYEVLAERQKKNRSNIKSSRSLATLEEERFTAAFERAQRKSRSALANHASSEEMLLRQQHQQQQESDRTRRKANTPTFLRSISDMQSADYRSVTSQGTSVNASVVSPLTPNSLEPREPIGKHSSSHESEDDMRYPTTIDSSGAEMNFSKPSRGLLQPAPTVRSKLPQSQQLHKKKPSPLAIIDDEDRRVGRQSLQSTGSAGGDVLAAWAELGGAEGILPSRAPRIR